MNSAQITACASHTCCVCCREVACDATHVGEQVAIVGSAADVGAWDPKCASTARALRCLPEPHHSIAFSLQHKTCKHDYT
eukprot:4960875-Amphidinium_carterae.3